MQKINNHIYAKIHFKNQYVWSVSAGWKKYLNIHVNMTEPSTQTFFKNFIYSIYQMQYFNKKCIIISNGKYRWNEYHNNLEYQ